MVRYFFLNTWTSWACQWTYLNEEGYTCLNTRTSWAYRWTYLNEEGHTYLNAVVLVSTLESLTPFSELSEESILTQKGTLVSTLELLTFISDLSMWRIHLTQKGRYFCLNTWTSWACQWSYLNEEEHPCLNTSSSWAYHWTYLNEEGHTYLNAGISWVSL